MAQILKPSFKVKPSSQVLHEFHVIVILDGYAIYVRIMYASKVSAQSETGKWDKFNLQDLISNNVIGESKNNNVL